MTGKTWRTIACVAIWIATLCILMFGEFKLDWPWDSLWTNPAAIRWMEVLKLMWVLAAPSLATVLIWWKPSSAAKAKDKEEDLAEDA